MKYIASIVFTSFIISLVSAQNPTVKWSPFFESKTDRFIRIPYFDANCVYTIRINPQNSQDYILEKYNSDFKLNETFKLNDVDLNYNLDNNTADNKVIHGLFRLSEKKQSKMAYTLRSYDLSNGSLIKKTELEPIAVSSDIYEQNFLNTSENKKFSILLLTNYTHSKKYSTPKTLNITLFDANGEKIWQKKIASPGFNTYQSKTIDVKTNNQGDVIILEKNYNTESNSTNDIQLKGRKIVTNYKYFYTLITENGKKQERFELKHNEGSLYNIKIVTNKTNDNFQIFGHCFMQEKGNAIYYGEISPKGEIVKSDDKLLEKDLFVDINKNNNAIDLLGTSFPLDVRLKINAFIGKQDGGAFAVLEFYDVMNGIFNSSGRYVQYDHYYGSMLIVSINQQGEIVWIKKIPKNQVHKSEDHSSVFAFVNNNQLGLVYNDHPENLDKGLEDKFSYTKNFKNSICILRNIDSEGKVSTKKLFDNKDIEGIFSPGKSKYNIISKILIIRTNENDNFKIGFVNLD